MATDVEDSDTDDCERPAPPKRRCTQLSEVYKQAEEFADGNKEKSDDEESQGIDDAARLARKKLKAWQMYQVIKGHLDNVINKKLENSIMNDLPAYPREVSRFQLFRGNEMEDTAVMTAIRNRGLVQSHEIVSQSHTFYSDKATGYCSRSRYIDVQCSCPPSRVQRIRDVLDTPTTSSDSERVSTESDMEQYNSDETEDFLERAVAEAIKKKGLSALSVDYG